MRTVAFIQARMSSSRFPGKVLADLGGQPMIVHMLARVASARLVDETVVLTSTDPSDDPLARALADRGQACHRGALDDVLGRFGSAAAAHPGDVYVRLTGDCPLIDPAVIDQVLALRAATGAEYCSNVAPPTYPDGLDVECFTAHALQRALAAADRPALREHVTLWMRDAAAGLSCANLAAPVDASHLRLTVDYPDDLAVVRQIVAAEQAAPSPFDFFDLLRVLDRDPDLRARNPHSRNEGLAMSLTTDAASATSHNQELP